MRAARSWVASVRMLTLRDLGAAAIKLLGVAAIKLLGVRYLAQTIAGLFSLTAMFFVPLEAGLPGASEMLPAQLMGTFGLPAAAIALIGGGTWLAERLLPPTPVGIGLGRLDAVVEVIRAALELTVGVVLALAARPAAWWLEARSQ